MSNLGLEAERKKFENFIESKTLWSLNKSSVGQYVENETYWMWQSWLASAEVKR